jgi:hypothetical protein
MYNTSIALHIVTLKSLNFVATVIISFLYDITIIPRKSGHPLLSYEREREGYKEKVI